MTFAAKDVKLKFYVKNIFYLTLKDAVAIISYMNWIMKSIIMLSLLLSIFIMVGLTVNTLLDDSSEELINHILLFIGGMVTGIFVFDNLFKKD